MEQLPRCSRVGNFYRISARKQLTSTHCRPVCLDSHLNLAYPSPLQLRVHGMHLTFPSGAPLQVQRGVQLLRDKSELAEAQAELAKMQMTATSANPPPSTQAPSALVAPPQTFPALTAPPAVAEEPAKPAALVQPQPQVRVFERQRWFSVSGL